MLGVENFLKVSYRIDGEALYRFHGGEVQRLIPWGDGAGAWRSTGGPWQAFSPEIHLPILEQTVQQARRAKLPSMQRRIEACQFLLCCWPDEVRQAVGRFTGEHWRLIEFLNGGSKAALELLESNPALGYLAATAGLAQHAGLRRRKLAGLLGFAETEHAVRLLGRVPIAWISTEFLTQLRAVIAQDREADAVLSHLERISPPVVAVVRDPALRAAVAPDCLTRLARLSGPLSHADPVRALRSLVEKGRARVESLADMDRPAAPPPPAAVRPRPQRSARQGLIFPAPPFPDLEVPGTSIHPIRTHQELIAEGALMHHCAGRERTYARDVAAGRMYFYRMILPERLTIALERIVTRWSVDEVRGVCNRLPAAASMTIIENWLAAGNAARRAAGAVDRRRAVAPRPVCVEQLSFDFVR